jgi:hypothetical protein
MAEDVAQERLIGAWRNVDELALSAARLRAGCAMATAAITAIMWDIENCTSVANDGEAKLAMSVGDSESCASLVYLSTHDYSSRTW